MKFDTIRGFLIVEKGECEKHPKAYTINLICLDKVIDGKKVNYLKASILLGAYLCMIKLLDCEQICMLELAGGYNNIMGLCAYTKFGFVPNKK